MNSASVGGPIIVLHDHLDGGVRPQTVLDLAAEHGLESVCRVLLNASDFVMLR